MLVRWAPTVRRLMPSCIAISLLRSPRATAARTSRSRSVSSILPANSLPDLGGFGEVCERGKIPQSITESGLLTNPVHALDLGLYLPAMIITSMLLWRRKLLGYTFAIPLLVFSVLTGIGILATFLVMSSKGMPTSLDVELFFAIIILVSLFLSVLFLREVK